MKRRLLAILLSIGILGGAFVGCGEKKEQPKEPQKQEQTKQENKIAEIKLKEPFEVKTKNGNYTVTINSIKTTKERNQYETKKVKQVVTVDYTYKNDSFKLSNGGELLVDDAAFTLMDGEGNVLRSYAVGTDEMPEPVPVGGKINATLSYGVPTNSKEIKFLYELSSGPIGEMIVDIK